MAFVLRLIGLGLLAACLALGVAVWDLGWNRGRIFYRFAGGEQLARDCTAPLRHRLVERGFSPVDITFGEDTAFSAASGSFGHRKSLAGAFTFSDGQDGPRIDGRMVCTVEGSSVDVRVEVDTLPRRMT